MRKKNIIGMVLAGGRVDELSVLTARRPKSAVSMWGMYRIIDFALTNMMHAGIEVVGSSMLGVLAARLIILRTPLVLRLAASVLRLQEDLLDKLLPQLLPLLLVLLYLSLLRRRVSPLWLALGTLLVGWVARLAGIL